MLGNDVHQERVEPLLVPIGEVTMHRPFEVADYVDFYCSEQHATNVGRIFRPDGDALTPNWKHLPIGYHGRAGTVVRLRAPTYDARAASARRRTRTPPPTDRAGGSTSRPSSASWSAAPTSLGESVPTSAFADHVFGVTPLNDWSARDIQAWEYVPLGPFLGKSFATSISPWITPLAALDGGPGRPAGPGPGAAATTCGSRSRPATTSTSRWCSTARW